MGLNSKKEELIMENKKYFTEQCPGCGGDLVIHADGTASCPVCGALVDGDYYDREGE